MDYLRHLRLPLQLTLAPLFLWGALLSGGGWSAATTAAFIALHLFLYPAAAAFSSAYDCDESPDAGMERSPEVPLGLARLALAWAAAGALLAAWAGAAFLLVYAGIAGWTWAYSRLRWEAHPWKGAAAIFLGQGALGFLAGWVATAQPGWHAEALLLGATGSALTALGLYPASRVSQLEEDRERGDRTLPIVLGPARALRLGALSLALGAAVTAWLVARLFGPPDALLIGLGYAGLIVALERLARLPPQSEETALYRPAMTITRWATGIFLLFIALEALGSG